MESIHTASKSNNEQSSYLWKPCTKNIIPVNHKKYARKIPLQGRLGGLRGAGYLARYYVNFVVCCLTKVSASNYSCCILINFIIMQKKSFLLPQPVVLPIECTPKEISKVTYYSDCVFKPYIRTFELADIEFIEDNKISVLNILTQLKFDFLLQAIKEKPKILDNIGVLKISSNERYGILVTKEKEGIFVSIIN